ncbi:MAG: rhodanese-like domain-containing protein [Nitrosopumilus sp.]|nr:rhodanese-like domain-containing protein [Nitrosopumilus sp.]MDH3340049.1 rhodanese-like domain-containing protein [Nitrosopumilus sp.]
MLVSVDWFKEHLSDPDIVILDSRPKTMFLDGHLTNAQSLSIEQVIRFDEFGSNLIIEPKKLPNSLVV